MSILPQKYCISLTDSYRFKWKIDLNASFQHTPKSRNKQLESSTAPTEYISNGKQKELIEWTWTVSHALLLLLSRPTSLHAAKNFRLMDGTSTYRELYTYVQCSIPIFHHCTLLSVWQPLSYDKDGFISPQYGRVASHYPRCQDHWVRV